MFGKLIVLFICLVSLFYLSGCVNGGLFLSNHQTQVELGEPNYELVATNLSGEAEAGFLFGVTYSVGVATETFALVRVDGSGSLYKDALENLWQNFEAQYGAALGRKLALVNLRYDADIINLFFYTRSKISIRADVIEFK